MWNPFLWTSRWHPAPPCFSQWSTGPSSEGILCFCPVGSRAWENQTEKVFQSWKGTGDFWALPEPSVGHKSLCFLIVAIAAFARDADHPRRKSGWTWSSRDWKAVAMGTTIAKNPRDVRTDEVCAMSPGLYSVTWGDNQNRTWHMRINKPCWERRNLPSLPFLFPMHQLTVQMFVCVYMRLHFLFSFWFSFCLSLFLFFCEVTGSHIWRDVSCRPLTPRCK